MHMRSYHLRHLINVRLFDFLKSLAARLYAIVKELPANSAQCCAWISLLDLKGLFQVVSTVYCPCDTYKIQDWLASLFLRWK
jgi:hypothetical protein